MPNSLRFLIPIAFVLILNCGCSSLYFSALEKIGIEKRELLISRIKEAKDAQEDAKTQFKSALEAYKTVIRFDGGLLEDKYEKLNSVLKKTEHKADEVRKRVQKVKEVAVALFREWKDELNQYSDHTLKNDSEIKLLHAKNEYSKMMASMRIATDKLDPALTPLRDKVLYLKHNLNAKAVSALDNEVSVIENKVEELIRELNQAIDDANSYMQTLED